MEFFLKKKQKWKSPGESAVVKAVMKEDPELTSSHRHQNYNNPHSNCLWKQAEAWWDTSFTAEDIKKEPWDGWERWRPGIVKTHTLK